MIKIGKLYIHCLTVAMFVVFFFNGHIIELCTAYVSMLLHETAHLITSLAIGLKISHFALYPFGVNLKLKNKLVANISDEIILYFSGPAVNILIASAAAIFKTRYSAFSYRINIALFIVNMLPVVPLDGGCIARKLLSSFLGTRKAEIFMRIIGSILSVFIFAAGIFIIKYTGYNYSAILIAVFIMGNIFTQKEKYNTEYIRELMFYRNKPLKRVKVSAAYTDEDNRNIAEKFVPMRYGIVCLFDRDGKLEKIKSEREIIDEIIHV